MFACTCGQTQTYRSTSTHSYLHTLRDHRQDLTSEMPMDMLCSRGAVWLIWCRMFTYVWISARF